MHCNGQSLQPKRVLCGGGGRRPSGPRAEAARQSPWPLCLGVAQLPALHQCRCVQHEEERHEECRNQQ